MNLIKSYCLIIWFLYSITTTSQELKPPIQNFSSVDYKGASQNWDMAVDNQGIVYAANNQGLLSFNGQSWKFMPLKNNAIIRSVFSHKGRIYTGSYQELGYWKTEADGEMEYVSLSPLFEEQQLGSEEFWEIIAFEDDIYFRSFGAIYKYTGKEVVEVKRVLAHKMAVHDKKLLLALGGKGLHYLEKNGQLRELPGQEVLSGETIADIEVKGSQILIATKNGFYVYENGGIQPHGSVELRRDLQLFEPNEIVALGPDKILIGTVKNGLIYLDNTTGDHMIINRRDGLQNNTVLSLVGVDGKIWVGLDNGIDLIHLDSPVSFLTEETGELGSVYDVTRFDDALFMASNTGVYKMNEDNQLSMIPGSGGHSWNLEVINEELYSNHNSGIFRIEKNLFSPVDKRTGSFQIHNYSDGKYLVGTYNGIDAYDKETGSLRTIKGTGFPARQIVSENPSTVWAAHAYDGLFRIELDPALDSVKTIEKIMLPEKGGNHRASVHKINNQIAVSLDNHWYRYNVFRDSLEIFKEMEDFSGYRLVSSDPDFYWFVKNATGALLGTDFKTTKFTIPPSMLGNRLVKGNEKVLKVADSLYYVTLHDGFAQVDLTKFVRKIEKEKHSTAEPTLHSVKDSQNRYSLLEPVNIPYSLAKEVSFSIGSPSLSRGTVLYELIGHDTLRGPVREGSLRFQNLSYGDYKLVLRNQNSQNDTLGIKTYNFSVLAPWYLTRELKMVYFIFILGILGIVYLINKKKLRKHRLLLEEKYQKEHKERLNNLEKEKLKDEITRKRKELANTTLVAAKKNEVLMEIQGELAKDKHKFTNEYRLKHIMSKINKAIKDKNEWEVFEVNFKELHEDFFRDLLEKYPGLSNKDLKLCSYLKMNLSSKEIAPLLGISVRGVEVHRYRLRKKMNLDSSENLTNFLIANF